jgi:beta-aspartyl-peptidase (threonine type)
MRGASLVLGWVFGLILLQQFSPSTGGRPPAASKKEDVSPTVLVIHGGAGVLNMEEMSKEKLENGKQLTREHYEAALAEALSAGYQALNLKGGTSVKGVEAAIRMMEDSELFNAGHGAALGHDGQAALDAAIMEGRMYPWKKKLEGKRDDRKKAGAVAGVTNIKNPISAARAVMEDGRQVLLVGPGAEWFALSEKNKRKYKIEEVSNVYFWTESRLRQIRKAVREETAKKQQGGKKLKSDSRRRGHASGHLGTVGAVALWKGTLAAGTSTGGLTDKLRGRVGDSPLIGAGTYADDRACGVSCTGTGEVFIRHTVAHDVVARMLYGRRSVADAVRETIEELPDEKDGVGGLIALDVKGTHEFGMSKQSVGMYRGYVTRKGDIFIAIFRDEVPKRMRKGKDGKWTKSKERLPHGMGDSPCPASSARPFAPEGGASSEEPEKPPAIVNATLVASARQALVQAGLRVGEGMRPDAAINQVANRHAQGVAPEQQEQRKFVRHYQQADQQQHLDEMAELTPAAEDLLGHVRVGNARYH